MPRAALHRSYFGLKPALKEDASQRFSEFVAQRTAAVAGRFRKDPFVNDKDLLEITNVLEAISPGFQKPGFKRNLKVGRR